MAAAYYRWVDRVYLKPDIDRAVIVVTSRLHDIVRNVKDSVLVPSKSGVLVHTRLQALFNLRFSDPTQRAVHEVIMTHAHAAERLGPGAFDLCIERLLEKLSGGRMGCNHPIDNVVTSDILRAGTTPASWDDVRWLLEVHLSGLEPMVKEMLLQALALAGFAGRIIVEKSRSMPSVELVRGYTFEHLPVWPMSTRYDSPRVVCIDGYVESVSELHHLLETAAATKDQVVLFLRGLSDDVKHTLKVNNDRGSLCVVPLVVQFDLQGINSLNDVSIACSADLVSSNKGDLISSIDLLSAPRVGSVTVHGDKVVITNSASATAVAVHVSELRRRRQNEQLADVGKLLDLRIRSLSPNHVVVRFVDDSIFVRSAQAVDYALRAVRSLVDHGTVPGRQMLVSTAMAAETHSTRCVLSLMSMGAQVRLT